MPMIVNTADLFVAVESPEHDGWRPARVLGWVEHAYERELPAFIAVVLEDGALTPKCLGFGHRVGAWAPTPEQALAASPAFRYDPEPMA